MAENYPCDVHKVMIKNNSDRLDKLDVIIDKVRNRLPVWATFIFGVLTLAIGYFIRSRL